MPFTKTNTNETKQQTLSEALGIDKTISQKMVSDIHDLMFEISEDKGECHEIDNSKFLLALYDKYNDKELLYAVYVGSRMLERHINPRPSVDGLLKFLMEK